MQNIGECMRESGQLDSAYHYLDGALKLARQGGITSYTAYLLSSLGNIYTEKKLYEKALAYKKASLNYSEKRNTIYLAIILSENYMEIYISWILHCYLQRWLLRALIYMWSVVLTG